MASVGDVSMLKMARTLAKFVSGMFTQSEEITFKFNLCNAVHVESASDCEQQKMFLIFLSPLCVICIQ